MGRLRGLDCNQNGSSTMMRISWMDVDEQSARKEPRPPIMGASLRFERSSTHEFSDERSLYLRRS